MREKGEERDARKIVKRRRKENVEKGWKPS